MKHAIDTQEILQYLAAFAKDTRRQETMHQLAHYLGAEYLLIFLPDPEVKVLLPAPGLPQTLPDGQRWQAFLASCRKDTPTYGQLPFPESTTLTTAIGLTSEEGIVLVLLGATPTLDLDKAMSLVTLLPLLEAVFRQEQARQFAEAEATVARSIATTTQDLLSKLDDARQELQNELHERHKMEIALREQLRLTALQMEVSIALTTGGTAREILGQCANALVHHLDAAFARIWTLNEAEQILELQASAGIYTRLNGTHARVPLGSFKVGMIGQKRQPHLTNTVTSDPFVDQEWAKREGLIAFAGYPLLVEDRLLGVMALFARHSLTSTTLDTMAAVAHAIALGTEHHRAVEALRKKRQILELALTASETGTFLWSPITQTLLEYDDNYKRLFGIAPNKPLGGIEEFISLVHPDDRQAVIAAIDRCRQGADFDMGYRIFHPNGSIHWLYNRAKMEYNDQGKPLYLVGACTDITRRKEVEEALRESVEHLRFMAESMPQKIFTAKPNGDVDYLNPQWMQFTGLTFEEIKDWGWLQCIHPTDVQENLKRWQHALETGEPFYCEHRFRRADGVYRWHVSRAIPMRDAQGQITMWIGSNTDITEQKELEHQKEMFVSMTTHELKTPLTSIKGYMQLAERRLQRLIQAPQIPPNELQLNLQQILSMLNRSQQQVTIQNRLITDLLDASRMQEGTLEIHLAPCDLKQIVSKTVENYQITYPQRQITVELPERTTPKVQGDGGRIEQVLSNYLTNALKYSANDKPIRVGLTYTPTDARIWVIDQGPGLSQEDQQHIWERFYRVPGIAIQNITGASLGLGLSICQAIIHSHRGHVGVESTPGQGACFWFTLPLHPPEL